jgi:probable rRNA maturation factor
VTAPRIEIAISGGGWGSRRKWRRLIEGAVNAAIEVSQVNVPPGCELSVLLSDDRSIRELNARWRGVDKPTNVLSFPADVPCAEVPDGQAPAMLGDIVLAWDTIAREADLAGKPFEHHFQHLMVHGFFHLIGYDHQDDSDAERMEELERLALKLLAVPDPYGPNDH